jgi:hypothetical protein
MDVLIVEIVSSLLKKQNTLVSEILIFIPFVHFVLKILLLELCIKLSILSLALPMHHCVAMMMLNRYFLREEVSGKQQLTPRNFLELYNVITAMPTWMLRNKMLLMCKYKRLCASMPSLLFSGKNFPDQGF